MLDKVTKKQLYIVAYEVLDSEPVWVHVVRESMDQDEANEIALNDYKECTDFDPEEDDEISIDDTLGSVWYETVTVNGYSIELMEDK